MIMDLIKKKATENHARVGIGVDPYDIKIMQDVKEIVEENKYAKLSFYENNEQLIQDLKKNKLDGIVRGQLSSNTFLQFVKKTFNISRCYRLALLETAENQEFFFAPVGIDEATSLAEKREFIKLSTKLLNQLGLEPKIGILAGGRKDDLGRDPIVDKTIEEADKIIEQENNEKIINYNILIEDAIKDEANVIIAPNGMSGNLIYRTLIHLGGGKSHGAPYLNITNPIIDTSRVAPLNEYLSAVCFASALKNI